MNGNVGLIKLYNYISNIFFFSNSFLLVQSQLGELASVHASIQDLDRRHKQLKLQYDISISLLFFLFH